MGQPALPVVVAHRGYAARYPENTLEACQAAVEAGAAWVEVDVQLRGAELVLAHDLPLTGQEPTLREFAAWLDVTPGVTALVEFKKVALRNHGRDAVVSACLAVMRDRWHPISFDYDALALAVARGAPDPGWIVCRYDAGIEAAARRISARWLIINYDFLPPGPAPAGWEWIVYEVDSMQRARDLLNRGVRWLETMSVGEILEGLNGH